MSNDARASRYSVRIRPITPRELAEGLGAHFFDITRMLVSQGQYRSSDEPMAIDTLKAFARNIGLTVEDGTISCPLPSGVSPKRRWIRFQTDVKRRSLRELFHFTRLDHLPGILSCDGLLCRSRLDARGMAYYPHRWGSPEKEQLLGSSYVCLSITNQWSMLGKEMSRLAYPPAVLVVKPRVVWYTGTCFCPTNSASRSVSATDLVNWTGIDRLDQLFPGPDEAWPVDSQAEVLVRDRVHLEDIKEVVFYDRASYAHALTRCGIDREDGIGKRVCISKQRFPSELTR